jgi:DNA-binding beta-propeller fold protein YncE
MKRTRVPLALAMLAVTGFTYAAPQRASEGGTPTQAVVFVLQRNNRLSVFDAKTLTLLGWFVTGGLGDGLSVRADGRVVYLLQALTAQSQLSGSHYPGCCSLQMLDLETRQMCFVSEPANLATLPHRPNIAPADVPSLPSLNRRDGTRFRPEVAAAGNLVVVYERTGAGLIMVPPERSPVGAFLVDRKTGVVTRHILPDVFFRDLVASPDGRFLYGIEDWPRGDPARFMRIDAGTGAITAERPLHPAHGSGSLVEEWSIAYADVPADLVPLGEVHPRPCR